MTTENKILNYHIYNVHAGVMITLLSLVLLVRRHFHFYFNEPNKKINKTYFNVHK